jgi:hypothetical protein
MIDLILQILISFLRISLHRALKTLQGIWNRAAKTLAQNLNSGSKKPVSKSEIGLWTPSKSKFEGSDTWIFFLSPYLQNSIWIAWKFAPKTIDYFISLHFFIKVSFRISSFTGKSRPTFSSTSFFAAASSMSVFGRVIQRHLIHHVIAAAARRMSSSAACLGGILFLRGRGPIRTSRYTRGKPPARRLNGLAIKCGCAIAVAFAGAAWSRFWFGCGFSTRSTRSRRIVHVQRWNCQRQYCRRK